MPTQAANPPDILTLDSWEAGMNQQGSRSSIEDEEQYWTENLFGIGRGNLRSCWGLSEPIYTAPAGKVILRVFFGFYGNTTPQFQRPPPGRLGWMFLSDGSIDEVDLDTRSVNHIPNVWEPIGPAWWASAKVWRPRFVGHTVGQPGGVLFGSPKGLYAWDGTTLSVPGGPAPDWLSNAAETPFPVPTDMPVGWDRPRAW